MKFGIHVTLLGALQCLLSSLFVLQKNLAICEDEQQIFIWMVDKLRRITLILNSTQISDKYCAMFGFCYTIMCWIKIQFEWQSYCFVGTVCHSLFAIPNK